jgi:hypothetical protein
VAFLPSFFQKFVLKNRKEVFFFLAPTNLLNIEEGCSGMAGFPSHQPYGSVNGKVIP